MITVGDEGHAMTWMEFIAAMSQAWAWPLLIAIVIWLFREPLGRILRNVKAIQHGDTRLILEELAEEAALVPSPPENISANDLQPSPAAARTVETDLKSSLEETVTALLSETPNERIDNAWNLIEAALRGAATLVDLRGERNMDWLSKRLAELGVISHSTAAVARNARDARNALIHDGANFTAAEAYRSAATRIAGSITVEASRYRDSRD